MKFKEVLIDFFSNFIFIFILLTALSVLFFLPPNLFIILSKQHLTLVLSALLSLFYIAFVLLTKKHDFVGNKMIYIAPLAFFMGGLISAIFSTYRYASFWGVETWGLSLCSIGAILAIFFIVINYLNRKRYDWLLFSFLAVLAVAQVIFIMTVAGALNVNWLPANLAGQNQGLAQLSLISTLIIGGLLSTDLNKKKLVKITALVGLALLNLMSLMIINSLAAWLVLMVGLIVFGGLNYWQRRDKFPKAAITAVALIAATAAAWLLSSASAIPKVPLEILPNAKTSYHIAWQAVKERPLPGVGLNNYQRAYNLYRPAAINQTAFWSETFYYSYSKFSDILTGGGLVATAGFLFFIGYFSYFSLRRSLKRRPDIYVLGLTTAWLAWVVGAFLFIPNLAVDLMAMIVLAGIVVSSSAGARPKRIKNNIRVILIFSLIALFIASATFLLFAVKRFVAAQAFFQGIKFYNEEARQEQVEKWLVLAADWDKNNDLYQRQLAHFYAAKLQNRILKIDQNDLNSEAGLSEITAISQQANEFATAAVSVNNDNYLNHLALYNFYEVSGRLAANAGQWQEKSLLNALATYPTNVYILHQLAKTELSQADLLVGLIAQGGQDEAVLGDLKLQATKKVGLAKEYSQRAIGLKPDYLPAYFSLGVAQWLGGEFEPARELMLLLDQQNPNDIGVKYYLALIMEANKDTAAAVEYLQQAIDLAPTFSEGRLILARLYLKQKQTKLARQTLEKILEYDPQNEQVLQILSNFSESNIATPLSLPSNID
ncbi:MAG: tetratricopeptide repeat protein [Patescibacteria group bacterium]